MSVNDIVLGMHRNITRRDFLNGVSVALAASVFNPARALAFEDSHAGKIEADSYPPTLTGMRGDHPGSFEVAHQMRDQGGWNLSGAVNTSEAYDLIVVGGGISGLAAAHFFRQSVPNAKILILVQSVIFLVLLQVGVEIDSNIVEQLPSRSAVAFRRFDVERAAVDHQSAALVHELVSLGVSAKVVVVIQS
jgi:hypothetical protein